MNPRALYCNDKCRMQYNRKRPEQDSPEQNEPEQVTRTDLSGVMFDDLYRRVGSYQGLDWKTSDEYKEIMLHTLTVEQLELEGQFVPCWKYKQEAA